MTVLDLSLSKYNMVGMDDFTPYPRGQFRYQAALENKVRKKETNKQINKQQFNG